MEPLWQLDSVPSQPDSDFSPTARTFTATLWSSRALHRTHYKYLMTNPYPTMERMMSELLTLYIRVEEIQVSIEAFRAGYFMMQAIDNQ
jgi:hypothetical protein